MLLPTYCTKMVLNMWFSLLFLFINYSIGIYTPPNIAVENQGSTVVLLTDLENIVKKTLKSFNIVLHFDRRLFEEQKDLIMHTFRLHSKIVLHPVVLDVEVHLGATLPSEMVTAARIIHILFFENYFDLDYLDDFGINWIPKYLLVINMSNVSYTQWLKRESVNQIKYVTLLQKPESAKNFEFITFRPFHESRRVFRFSEYSIDSCYSIDDIFIDRFRSFAGHEFHLATHYEDMPFLYPAKSNKMSQYDKLSYEQILQEFDNSPSADGLAVDMLNALSGSLHFSYSTTNRSSDTKWGSFENGSFTGMLDMIQNEGYDFTVNYFGLTSERYTYFDHTVPYWNEGFGISLTQPDSTPKWFSIALPFSPKLWAGIVATMIAGMIFFWVLVSITSYSLRSL